MTDPFFIERHPIAETGPVLDRLKRLRRAGWSVHVLYEQKGDRQGAGDELVALGWRNFADSPGPEPDRTGQTEIDLNGL